jgi:hypothetical protein
MLASLFRKRRGTDAPDGRDDRRDERREEAKRRLDERWIDVGAFSRNTARDRYEWYDAGWRNWMRRHLSAALSSRQAGNEGDDGAPYWWPLSTPLIERAMLASRLHVMYRVADKRIVQFIEIVE